jgi:type II secretory pathway pseudopilin PulG
MALAILGVAAAGACRVLLPTVRTVRRQARQVGLAQNLRAATSVLSAELRGLDARDSDIIAFAPTAITARMMRRFTVLCADGSVAPNGGTSLLVRDWSVTGLTEAFVVGDSVLLYRDGDLATRADDAWWRARVGAVGPEQCPDPDHPRPGYRLRLDHPAVEGGDAALGLPRGTPLRGFATVTYSSYRSTTDGDWYLGQLELPGTVQPLVGPLDGRDGLTFFYYDSTGAPTTEPTAVREIEIHVRGRTAVGSGGSFETDSVVARVTLRNNPLCPRCP